MVRNFSCNLSNLNQLSKNIKDYRQSFSVKVQEFLQKLAQVGISVARNNLGYLEDLGDVSGLVWFYAKTNPTTTGCQAIMYGKDIKIIQKWYGEKGIIRQEEVSPLLMYEFGSGNHAEVMFPLTGVGRGSFPNQTHAFEDEGWCWQTLDGEWHYAPWQGHMFTGITPTHPMYKAVLEMRSNIQKIGQEVFGS